MAERVGFEPTVATGTTTVFETVPFNRSGTSPQGADHSQAAGAAQPAKRREPFPTSKP